MRLKTWLKQQWKIRHRKTYGELRYLLKRHIFGDRKEAQEYPNLIYKAKKSGDDEYVHYLQELLQCEEEALDRRHLLIDKAAQEYANLIYEAQRSGDDVSVHFYLQELLQEGRALIDYVMPLATSPLTRQERLEGIRRQIDKMIEIRKESGEIN